MATSLPAGDASSPALRRQDGVGDVVTAVAGFAATAIVILLVAPRMARVADRLGEVTGLGGALFGAVFLALATDLPEVALTPAAVLSGTPGIAVGGLLGSAAAQLTLIGVVDIAFRQLKLPGRLSLNSIVGQCALMMAVLAVPLLAATGVPSIGGVGYATVLLPCAYFGMLYAIRRIGGDDASPASPKGAKVGSQENGDHPGARGLWLRFGLYALLLAGAGVVLEATTERVGSTLGLGETAAGALLAGIVTSLPELVTAISAARVGALDLAAGDLVGSSALDVALLSLADVVYTDGSIFSLLGPAEFTLIGVALAITSLLVVGLARRDRTPGIAIESYLMLAVYALGAVALIV